MDLRNPTPRLLSVLAIGVGLISPSVAAAELDFNKDIRPIFAENCYLCHGPDKSSREAGLRLDLRDIATSEAESGMTAIVPGNPDESELILRVSAEEDFMAMPPEGHGERLSDEQIALLRKWIEEGAKYETHWAFTSPTIPKDIDESAELNPIDQVVRKRLTEKGLTPNRPAEPAILCRRIYLDVIGLPPTPQQVSEFEAAVDAGSLSAAVEQLVDTLLDSPHYGEKWARHWLDVARYADSNGFEKDLPREQWAWRDWVINAINEDKPYDQFIIEQVAGDLLPDRTQGQLVASGFLRNGMVNEEGAIIYEQFRIEGNFDRMDCIGKAVLGLSLQCAQCHTHKFDPITHDEYYSMFAFVNDTYEAQSWVYTDEQFQKIESIRKKVAGLEEQIRQQVPDWRQKMLVWEQQLLENANEWERLTPTEVDWEGGLNHPEVIAEQSVVILGHPTVTGTFRFDAEPQTREIREIRLEALKYGDLPFFGPGRSYWGTFAISELEIETKLPDSEKWEKVKLASALTDFEHEERELDEFFHHGGLDKDGRRKVGPVSMLIDGDMKTAWAPDRGPILRHTESVAIVRPEQPLELPEGSQLRIFLRMNHGGDGNGRDNQQLGRLRLSVASQESAGEPIDHAARLALETPADERTEDQQAALFRAWRKSVDDLESLNQQIAEAEAKYPEAETSVLHLAETMPRDHRLTTVYDRGEWNKPDREVTPGVLDALHPMEVENPTRLDFARWLADKDSPLTARVQVNRTWQAIFGIGLVETSEDFGTRAPSPEYRDILDWLAVDFMRNGWSQKDLVRTILNSQTYQQSSVVSEEEFLRDPKNQLLARGPRFRAQAEVIRDIALSVAGLLSDDIGGPSIFPPVPQSVLDYNFSKVDYWNVAEGEDRYRRSLYVFRKRSMPDPVLTSFDSPNSDFACARRVRSNTPLSALVSLNEPVFVEAAQALALRILREAGPTTEDRVDFAYRLCTSRHATDAECTAISALLDQQRERLAEGWLSIHDVAFGKDGKRPELPEGVSPRDVAEWTLVSRVLLNLDETLTKN